MLNTDQTAIRLLELSAGLGLLHEQLLREASAISRRDVRTASLACTALRAAQMQIATTAARELRVALEEFNRNAAPPPKADETAC